MSDHLTTEQRSLNMAAIKGKDTAPEMIVRRLVHRLGYRYRLHRKDLPGKPDLVFASRRAVIFVHGCFWHQHAECKARPPRSNIDYWLPKLERNVERDREHQRRLRELGWRALVIWECETKDIDGLRERVMQFLNGKQQLTTAKP